MATLKDAAAKPARDQGLYNRLAVLRAERGISRQELADALGINYQTGKRYARRLTERNRLNVQRLLQYQAVVDRAKLLMRDYPEKSFRKLVRMAAPQFGINANTVLARFYEGLIN